MASSSSIVSIQEPVIQSGPYVMDAGDRDLVITAPIFCAGNIVLRGRNVQVKHIIATKGTLTIVAQIKITHYGEQLYASKKALIASKVKKLGVNMRRDSSTLASISHFVLQNPTLCREYGILSDDVVDKEKTAKSTDEES